MTVRFQCSFVGSPRNIFWIAPTTRHLFRVHDFKNGVGSVRLEAEIVKTMEMAVRQGFEPWEEVKAPSTV